MANKSKNTILSDGLVKSILLYLAIIFVLLIFTIVFLKVFTQHNREYPAPDFTGMTVDEATPVAHDYKVHLDVCDSVYAPRMSRGVIYSQNPKPGALIKKGRRIILTINAVTPRMTTMPDVVGYSLRQARAELTARGLRLEKFIYERDMATNNVLRQLYDGEEIEAGAIIEMDSPITLVCGLNPSDSKTFIPDLEGLPLSRAVSMLYDNSLNIGNVTYDSQITTYKDSLAAVVCRQYPVACYKVKENPADTTYVLKNNSATKGSSVSLVLTLPEPEEEPVQ